MAIPKNEKNEHKTLLRQISAGDHAAFKQLFLAWQPRIYRYVYLRVRDVEAAEDVVQEVFFRLWKKREQLPQSSNFNAFIFQIAHNLVVDWARKNQVRQRAQREISVVAQSSYTINTETEASQLEQEISSQIHALPPAMQQAFVLHRIEHLTYKQIAKIMGISIKTVEKHIGAALKRLRAELRKQGFF